METDRAEKTIDAPRWRGEGLLFENCNCQVLCPAHVSFKQNCTHERCLGYWAIHFDCGAFGDTPLDGLNAVIVYDTPQRMYEGTWTEAFYLDERADKAQRAALQTIFSGQAGGPWAVLARFVSTWLEPRFVPLRLEDDGRRKSIRIDGVLDSSIEAMKGPDGSKEVVLENLFNQIHGFTHVLAKGATRLADRELAIETKGTHALYSRFSWQGP